MKTKLAVLLLCLAWVGTSHAASAARGAKQSLAINYTTAVSTVALNADVVIYGVVMSTGATGDFVALFDTTTAAGISSGVQSSVLKTRCMAGSASVTTMCLYDPPLQFSQGGMAVLSTANDAALIVYEPGRLSAGY